MKSILMIGGGIQQVPAVKRLQDIGYEVIVSDQNPDAPAFKDANHTVHLGATAISSLISWVLIHKAQLKIAGIFTLTNYAATVSLVAEATRLPCLHPSIVIQCDNKLLMKRLFLQYGFLTPRFHEVSSVNQAKSCFQELGATAYLKVVDGFGGKGIAKITCSDDIGTHWDNLIKSSAYPSLILEEEIKGHFIDTQGIFYQDKFYRAGDADSFFSHDKEEYSSFNPVEIYNICPSQRPHHEVDAAYEMLKNIAIKMDMVFGPVGGDFVATKRGMYVIEVGPRLHGPNGSLQMFPYAQGIKPLEFMAQVLCSDEPDTLFLKNRTSGVALCKVYTTPKKYVNHAGFTENPLKYDGVFASNTYFKAGKAIEQKESSLSGLASVFVGGCDLNEAESRLQIVDTLFQVS